MNEKKKSQILKSKKLILFKICKAVLVPKMLGTMCLTESVMICTDSKFFLIYTQLKTIRKQYIKCTVSKSFLIYTQLKTIQKQYIKCFNPLVLNLNSMVASCFTPVRTGATKESCEVVECSQNTRF